MGGCQGHEDPQEQRIKERSKFNFQTRNKTWLYDLKTIMQELKTITWNVQNKSENGFLLC
jgi:hypothetical protein